MKKLLFFLSIFIVNIASALPPPYDELEEVLPFNGHGWYGNAEQIEELIRKHQVKTIIGVGSWLGASTRHMAALLPAGGKVYAIDHWLGSAEHQPNASNYLDVLPYLYEQFLSNVIHAKLTDKIVPIRMDSLAAANTIDVIPDLIYIDASHDTPSVYADLQAWYPFVQGHGVLCGDDWGWSSVRAAVERFAKENHLKIDASGNFWRLKE